MEKLLHLLHFPAAQALAATLFHSTWQLASLAILYVLSVRFIQNPVLRYRLGISLLVSQFLISFITFFVVWSPATPRVSQTLSAPMLLSPWQQLVHYLHQNAALILGCWLLGVIVLTLRTGFGVFGITLLRRHESNTFNSSLQTMADTLASKMDITKTFTVMTSTAVNLPVLIGHLKPLILIPVSVATGFSASQLEVILAHELAHLKRHDYLFNLLQTVVDILFFFHPGVWYLSHQIRHERELACDAQAVQITGHQIVLAHTLAQLQTQPAVHPLALAFGKKRMPLLERIQALVGKTQRQNRTRESIVLLLVMGLSFLVFSQKPVKQSVTQKTTHQTSKVNGQITADTIRHEYFDGKQRLVIETMPHQISVNGKKVELTPEQQANYQKHFQKMQEINSQLEGRQTNTNSSLDRVSEISEEISKLGYNMGELGEQMSTIGTELSKNGQKLIRLHNTALKKLENPKLSEEERKTIGDELGKKTSEIEHTITELEKELKPIVEKREALENLQAKRLEILEQYHQDIADKQTKTASLHNALAAETEHIAKFLPKEVQQIYKKMQGPPPPPPPAVAPPPPPPSPAVAPPPPPPPPPFKKSNMH